MADQAPGSGPLSRKSHPKQFLKLFGQHSLLQATAERVQDKATFSDITLVCAEAHSLITKDHLEEIGIDNYSIITEPVAKNTAPAAAIAALKLVEKDPDAIMLILSADHDIRNNANFVAAINAATIHANNGKIVTFGMLPTAPETGYGYIKQGKILDQQHQVYEIENFVEKPNKETAKSYLEAGDYSWNGGIFLMKAHIYLDELKRYRPEIYQSCIKTLEKSATTENFTKLSKEEFSKCPSDSIDYAIMENTKLGTIITVDIGWTDIGSWDMVWELNPKDKNGNVTNGEVLLQDCKNSYFFSQDSSLVTAYGIENLIVVKTGNATLIVPKDKAQDVKKIINEMMAKSRPELEHDNKVSRPWGSYEVYADAPHFKVKQIIVKPGAKLSLQSHNHRAEHWVVVKGVATVTKGDKVFELHANQSTYINKQELHRLENKSEHDVHIIEIQTCDYFGEDDIIRYDDVYGRVDL